MTIAETREILTPLVADLVASGGGQREVAIDWARATTTCSALIIIIGCLTVCMAVIFGATLRFLQSGRGALDRAPRARQNSSIDWPWTAWGWTGLLYFCWLFGCAALGFSFLFWFVHSGSTRAPALGVGLAIFTMSLGLYLSNLTFFATTLLTMAKLARGAGDQTNVQAPNGLRSALQAFAESFAEIVTRPGRILLIGFWVSFLLVPLQALAVIVPSLVALIGPDGSVLEPLSSLLSAIILALAFTITSSTLALSFLNAGNEARPAESRRDSDGIFKSDRHPRFPTAPAHVGSRLNS